MISSLALSLLAATLANSALARISVGYYSAENVYKGFKIRDIPARQLTHLNYAFGAVSSDGTITIGDVFAATQLDPSTNQAATTLPCTGGISGNLAELFELKKRFPHLRTLLSVGGWGDNITQSFSQLAQNPTGRKRFAETAATLLSKYGFDGLDVDWEFPRGEAENANFVDLLKECRASLDAINDGRPYALTIAVPAITKLINSMRVSDISSVVDWMNIMAYDYAADLNVTFHNTPMYTSDMVKLDGEDRSIDSSVRAYVIKGSPRYKLVMGLPLYGYLYEGVGKGDTLGQPFNGSAITGNVRATPISYGDILVQMRSSAFDWKSYYDDKAESPWLYQPFQFKLVVYMDAQKALPKRIDYVKNMGMGGVMFWQLGQDSALPPSSIVLNSIRLLFKTDTPQFKKFPVCAPKSDVCNIKSDCDLSSANFKSADDLSGSMKMEPSMLFTFILLAFYVL